MFSYMNFFTIVNIFYFFLIKGLIKVYTIKELKQIRDIPHVIIVNECIIISILLSLFVQLLFIDKVSL